MQASCGMLGMQSWEQMQLEYCTCAHLRCLIASPCTRREDMGFLLSIFFADITFTMSYQVERGSEAAAVRGFQGSTCAWQCACHSDLRMGLCLGRAR